MSGTVDLDMGQGLGVLFNIIHSDVTSIHCGTSEI